MTSEAIKPVYVLVGSDQYLRDLNRQRITRQVIGDGDPQLCVSSFDGEAELAAVLDELRTLPFLASRRVVVIDDADAFISRYRQIEVEKAPRKFEVRRPLDEYLRSPSRTASLILMVSSWPSNTTLARAVAEVGEVVDCAPPEGSELAQRIRDALRARGKKIAADAVELLVAWVGPDLAAIESEAEKLSLYAGQRETITVKDVSELVTATAGAGTFELTDAIVAGDARAALSALQRSLTRRGEEFRLLALLASTLRRAAKAHGLIASGTRPDDAVGRMPYSARNAFVQYLRRRSPQQVRQDFRRLIAADLGLKSGLEAHAAMQDLVVALCT
jgi:DNA polymerase-3 subunit delta